jgi:hypothetical protein
MEDLSLCDGRKLPTLLPLADIFSLLHLAGAMFEGDRGR